MRLNRLDLTRFGKFTDLSLSFPVQTPGNPDLHVIYGANEAGKSTLLEGWLDMLFQIPVRSSMGFARNNGPVPFIADDIMESFDDDRTAEAFGLLAEMSKSGQLIYLTHRAHLCDIARNICPSVCIHELQG